MNARTDHSLEPTVLSNAHLDALEEEAIFILREVAASFERPICCFLAARIRWYCSNALKKHLLIQSGAATSRTRS